MDREKNLIEHLQNLMKLSEKYYLKLKNDPDSELAQNQLKKIWQEILYLRKVFFITERYFIKNFNQANYKRYQKLKDYNDELLKNGGENRNG
jgi:hypothetical protein